LKIPVVTILPFHTTWRGSPTLTESSRMFILMCLSYDQAALIG
jgi:hypothetical protein